MSDTQRRLVAQIRMVAALLGEHGKQWDARLRLALRHRETPLANDARMMGKVVRQLRMITVMLERRGERRLVEVMLPYVRAMLMLQIRRSAISERKPHA